MEQNGCNQFAACIKCPLYGGDTFYYLRLLAGYNYRQYRFKQNSILFILSGKLKIQGLHFPPTVLEKGRMFALPIGVEVDMAILEDTTWLAYRCNELPMLCDTHYEKFMHLRDECENGQSLEMIPPLLNFAEGIHQNLQNGALCQKFFEIKEKELIYLLTSYFPQEELIAFIHPLLKTQNKFRSFVMQYYYKVKTVEELAILGKYGIVTFRRLFKEEFGEPAYQWMTRQRQEHILYDLTHRNDSISEIADKYLFESLSQFSNFCKKNLHASPRELQMKKHN